MDLFKVKLAQISQHGELLDQYGASVRILGQRDLIRPDILEACNNAVEVTRGNGEFVYPQPPLEELQSANLSQCHT